MRKLSEIKGEEALDVLAEIIEPAAEIFTDENVKKALKSESRIKAAKIILKDHKKAILTLMATLEETPVEEYKPTLLALPALIIEVLNDPELNSLF